MLMIVVGRAPNGVLDAVFHPTRTRFYITFLNNCERLRCGTATCLIMCFWISKGMLPVKPFNQKIYYGSQLSCVPLSSKNVVGGTYLPQ